MSTTPANRRVTLNNPQGLHARPADLFARRASKFESKIEVIKSGHRVDGKSILDILTLAAEYGTELEIEATGRDAAAALDALVQLIESNFASDDVDQEQAG